MNNMKGKGVVLFGVVLSLVGIGIACVSGKKAYDDYKKMDKYSAGHIDLSDSSKLNVVVGAGTVTIHHSETTTSYVDYNVADYYQVKYDEEKAELKMYKKWQYWFMWDFSNKNTMDVYLTEKDYEACFDLNAGKFIIDGDFSFTNLTIDVSAGDFKSQNNTLTVTKNANVKISAGDISINNLICGENASLKVSAGDLDVKYVEAKKTDIKISAGDISTKVKSDVIDFKISAGDLDLTIVGDLKDYNTDIDKSAGSCSLSKDERHQTGRTTGKELNGDISAGSADITFVSE